MDSGPTLNVHPILAVTILTAIPVVAFALWAEYYGRAIDAVIKAGPPGKGEELDRPAELRRSRYAGIYAFIVVTCTYLATAPLRQDHPLAGLLVFLTALISQSQVQAGIERRIRGTEEQAQSEAMVFAKTLIWTMASLVFYFALIWGALYGTHTVLVELAVAREKGVWILAGVGIASIFGATALLLALTPFHLRKMLPVSLMPRDSKRDLIERCFARNGFRPPEIYIIELDGFRFTNAVISGFMRGRGIFRPALFLSKPLLEKFSYTELEAIILHEASHWALHHARRRFVNSLAVIVLSTLALSFAFIAGQLFLPPGAQALLRVATTVAALFLPFALVRQQTEKHEYEADRHCVLSFGADLEAFALALRKIDTLNDSDSGQTDPFNQFNPAGGHPTTEMRILRVRTAYEKFAKTLEKAESGPKSNNDSYDQAA